MSGSDLAAARRIDRLLAALAEGEAHRDGPDGDRLTVVGAHGLRRRRLDVALLTRMTAAGLVDETTDPGLVGATRLALTAAGRARLRRVDAGGADVDGFRLQHGDVARLAVDGGTRLVERAESPLAWLARRRDKDGRALLSPARLAAGERLRADFTRGEMTPTVTSNWSTARLSGGRGPGRPGGLDDLTDRALAARGRVHTALDAVGADLAGVLVDVCCFLKGLEKVESERRWPARSAKVVLDIALGRLADHYGLAEETRGPDRAPALRAWGTPDHRPTVGAAAAS